MPRNGDCNRVTHSATQLAFAFRPFLNAAAYCPLQWVSRVVWAYQ